MKFVASSLQDKHSEDKLRILIPKSNANNLTYDGVEVGGERVTEEVEEEMSTLLEQGHNVTKISIVGYSLGGLVARYAIGLLYSRGFFDRFEPVNFTTFATPHLGVRSPVLGWRNSAWNALGGRTLSTSGRQIFLIDSFRDTGKPLLSVMTDPSSIFIQGLKAFQRRSLYANIINDRSVPYYTASFSPVDPFLDMDAVKLKYVPDYDEVILDSQTPAEPKTEEPSYIEYTSNLARAIVNRAPFAAAMTLLLPIATTAFLINAGVQTYQSSRRVRSHEEAKAHMYRLPLFLETAKRHAESALEAAGAQQGEDYLPNAAKPKSVASASPQSGKAGAQDLVIRDRTAAAVVGPEIGSPFPTLACTPGQFQMIEALDEVGFDKYPVHIHDCTHTHAAIIVRMPRERFHEGKVVARHWVERFIL